MTKTRPVKQVIKISENSDLENIALGSRGSELFHQYLPELMEQYPGQLIAIEIESGEYFVASEGKTASQIAEEKYPDKILFVGVVPKGHRLPRSPSPKYLR